MTGGDLTDCLRAWVRRYPRRGYSGMFLRWVFSDDLPAYGSWGNDPAIRVGPVGHAAPELDTAMRLAEQSATFTHNHPEAIRGAQAVVVAIRLALDGGTSEQVRDTFAARFGYDLAKGVNSVQSRYAFEVSYADMVPPVHHLYRGVGGS